MRSRGAVDTFFPSPSRYRVHDMKVQMQLLAASNDNHHNLH